MQRSKLPTERRHVWLYVEDLEYLEETYGPQGDVAVGVSAVIREMIHVQVLALKAKRQAEFDAIRARARGGSTPGGGG